MNRRITLLVVFFAMLFASTVMAQSAKVSTMLCPEQSMQDLLPPTYKVEEFRFDPEVKGKVTKPTPIIVRSKGDDATLGVILFQGSCPGVEIHSEQQAQPAATPQPMQPQQSLQATQTPIEAAPSQSATSTQSPVCDVVVDEDEREVYDLRSFEEYGYFAGLLELGRSCDKFAGQNMANYMSRVKDGLLPADATPDPKGSAKMFAAWEATKNTTTEIASSNPTNNTQLVTENQSLREQLNAANQQITRLKNQPKATTNSVSNNSELEEKVTKLELELNDTIGERDEANKQRDAANERVKKAEEAANQWRQQYIDAQKQIDDSKSAPRAAQLPAEKSGSSGAAPNGAAQAAPAKQPGSETVETSKALAALFVPWRTEQVPVRNFRNLTRSIIFQEIHKKIREKGDNQTRHLWQTDPDDICGNNPANNPGFATARSLVGEELCKEYWQHEYIIDVRKVINWPGVISWFMVITMIVCAFFVARQFESMQHAIRNHANQMGRMNRQHFAKAGQAATKLKEMERLLAESEARNSVLEGQNKALQTKLPARTGMAIVPPAAKPAAPISAPAASDDIKVFKRCMAVEHGTAVSEFLTDAEFTVAVRDALSKRPSLKVEQVLGGYNITRIAAATA